MSAIDHYRHAIRKTSWCYLEDRIRIHKEVRQVLTEVLHRELSMHGYRLVHQSPHREEK